MPTDYSQPGIINALDYGLVPNDSSSDQALANTQALLSAIAAAQASCDQTGAPQYGGVVIIPSNDAVPNATSGDGGIYYFATLDLNAAAITISCQYPLQILGTGNATTLIMTSAQDLFAINNVTTGETGPAVASRSKTWRSPTLPVSSTVPLFGSAAVPRTCGFSE
jgi:hypothetical protein